MDMMMLSGLWLFVLLFLFVLAVLWFLLPFAVFGVKDRLAEQTAQLKRTNELLAQMLAQRDTTPR